MNIKEFQAALEANPDSILTFMFDDGETIPPDFHVTEVGHVVKNFIDCGGTRRSVEACLLQAWVASNDESHRLTAGKLARIIELARPFLPSDTLDVEVEYEGCVLSQYRVEDVESRDGTLRFSLADKHTDCLAKEACGLEASGCGSGSKKRGCC